MNNHQQESEISFKDGVVQSLCYLHQEALKEGCEDFASVIQCSIECISMLIEDPSVLSEKSESWLQQFYVLRGFQALSRRQKELFLREIEKIEQSNTDSLCKH